jgi:NADPH-dependent 2,4-dienoyl-CoA reductase/sulfur reductase-like enzyme
MDVFGHEAELGEHVVVIGGAMTGVDTAFYLLNHGHKVTLLTREREAAHDYCAHNQGAFKELLNSRENLTIVTNCQTQKIGNGTIDYTVTFGAPAAMPPMGNPDDMPPMPGPMPMNEGPKEPPRVEAGSVSFDSVVVSAGREGLVDECFAFAGKTPEFYVAGDANLMSFESLTHSGTGKMDGPTTQGTIRNAMYTAYTAASNL